VRRYLTGGASGSYYYIPMLVQMYLLSPLLVPLAKKHWRLTLLVTARRPIRHRNQHLLDDLSAAAESLAQTISELTPALVLPQTLLLVRPRRRARLPLHQDLQTVSAYASMCAGLIAGTVFFYPRLAGRV
jgi:peptidoglycan/LPS O-acetylase OafA/YrhL